MKLTILYVAVLFLAACSSVPNVTIQREQTIPADTGRGFLYGQYGSVVHNPDCDSLQIFRQLLEETTAQLSGEVGRYRVELETSIDERNEALSAIDSLAKRVQYFRVRARSQVVAPPQVIPIPAELTNELDRLRGETSEQRVELAEADSLKWKLYVVVGVLSLVLIVGVGIVVKKHLPFV